MLALSDLLTQEPFRGFDQMLSGTNRTSSLTPPMDAYRRGETVWIHLDLPGVTAESIEIDIERSVLTVIAERRWEMEEGDQLYAAERRQGTFRRQFHLGQGLDTEAVQADYRDGVLTLRVPVAERARPRKIEVTQGIDVASSPGAIGGTEEASDAD